jgi:hypothetical protein
MIGYAEVLHGERIAIDIGGRSFPKSRPQVFEDVVVLGFHPA